MVLVETRYVIFISVHCLVRAVRPVLIIFELQLINVISLCIIFNQIQGTCSLHVASPTFTPALLSRHPVYFYIAFNVILFFFYIYKRFNILTGVNESTSFCRRILVIIYFRKKEHFLLSYLEFFFLMK